MHIRLSDLEPGQEATIVSIKSGQGMRRRLHSQGISEGRSIQKLSAMALGGPVVIRLNRAQVAIGRGMANKIIVSTQDE